VAIFPFHNFDCAPVKIIFQAFSLRDKMQTRVSPINTNSICRSGVSAEHCKPFEIQGCGGLPTRRYVHGSPIFFQFVPPPLRVKFFA
jgi:hypothetical protein